MLLPNLDFELTYWRMRRLLQRARGAYRLRVSHERAAMQLRYMRWFGQMPEPVQPEDTLVYRLMWAIVIVGLIGVITIDSTIGEEEFLNRTHAVVLAIKNFPQQRVEKEFPAPVPAPEIIETDQTHLTAWLKKST